MKKRYLIFGTIVIVLCGLTWFISYLTLKEDPIKFVSMVKVYDQSNLRKKYEQELNKFETDSNNKLYQLESEIKERIKNGAAQTQIEYFRSDLVRQREALSSLYAQKSDSLQELVWDDINTKINAFGKEHEFKFILGGTGNGAIMYANDDDDVTDDVIKYVNK